MKRWSLYLLLVAATAAASWTPAAATEPVVYFESLHNLDWAQIICDDIMEHHDRADSTPEARELCASALDARGLGRKLELDVQSRMATDPVCGGVTVVRGWHPKFDGGNGSRVASILKGERWDLWVELRPASSKQTWTLIHSEGMRTGATVDGEGTPAEIARAVCLAVSGRGAIIH
jgi:hypothetical protein